MTSHQKSLSQDEIDALFTGGADAGDANAPIARKGPEVRLYDFRRPSRVSKDRQRTLEGMYSVLVKALEGWLAGRVRAQVDVDLSAVEQLTFGEFVLSLPDPCASFVFNIGAPGGPQCVIDIGGEFAYYAVERFLGSGSGETYVPERGLTVLERRIVRIIVEKVAGLLSEIWEDHARMDLRLARFEAVPDMLQAANREDMMLVAHLRFRFRGKQSPMLICLPFAVLDSFFATSSRQRVQMLLADGEEVETDRESASSSLRRAQVPVLARLPAFELTFGELMQLRPGGTLMTGIDAHAPIELSVGGRPRFHGYTGRVKQRLAVQVTDTIQHDEEELDV